MSAYGEDYLISIQTDLTGKGGIDSNGNYIENHLCKVSLRF